VLAVGNFGTFPFRGQLSGKPLPASTFLSGGTEIKAQGRVENSIRVGSAGLVISSPNAMKVYRSPPGRSACHPRKVMWE
jgi:hypothetical protein